MSDFVCCLRAGFSTALGFAAVQLIENFIYGSVSLTRYIFKKFCKNVDKESVDNANATEETVYISTPPTSRSWRAVSMLSAGKSPISSRRRNSYRRSSFDDYDMVLPPTSSNWRGISYVNLSIIGSEVVTPNDNNNKFVSLSSSSANLVNAEINASSSVSSGMNDSNYIPPASPKKSLRRGSRGKLSMTSLSNLSELGVLKPSASNSQISYDSLGSSGINVEASRLFDKVESIPYVHDIKAIAKKRDRNWASNSSLRIENDLFLPYTDTELGIEYKSSRLKENICEESHLVNLSRYDTNYYI
jgi:hypothetical protein